jgi:hypothetical protein
LRREKKKEGGVSSAGGTKRGRLVVSMLLRARKEARTGTRVVVDMLDLLYEEVGPMCVRKRERERANQKQKRRLRAFPPSGVERRPLFASSSRRIAPSNETRSTSIDTHTLDSSHLLQHTKQ